MLTTLAKVKERLGLDETDIEDDALLTRIIQGTSGRFDRHCNRTFARTEGFTEEFAGDDTELRVSCYPLEEVTAFDLKTTQREGWVAQTLTDIDYLTRQGCVISLTAPLGNWRQQLRVTYTGGYVLPGTEAGAGQTALPAEIEHACLEQVAYWWQNKDRLGLNNLGAEAGGSIQRFYVYDLLPDVEATLKRFQRFLA